MTTPPGFYVTTPIYYVNDAPHLGHAYTTVAADALARYHRLRGEAVRFVTGTDEHGQKVYRAALDRGLSPREHVDRMVRPYQELWKRLDIRYDDFIRTTEPRHVAVVQGVLQRLHEQGELYKASYSGWYSTSEERFWTEKDLVDGRCPLSGNPVEWITEENWFFRMGKYRDRLVRYIQEHPTFILPESRRNEVLGYLRRDLDDLCISRPRERLPWGIEIPFDRDYVTYVWFDALINYVSAIEYGKDTDTFERFWPAAVHLVGKDILTTHAVYWSAMLFAMGEPLVQTLFAHGWWTIEGRKMSKSLKNVVDPHLLLDAYGPDALRYFLLREVAFGNDGDFSHRAFQLRYNADLANDLGNLAHRTLSMTGRWLDGRVPERPAVSDQDARLEALARETVETVDARFLDLELHGALASIWDLVRAGNKYIDTEQPWALNREGRRDRLATVMRNVLEVCRIAGVLVYPVCPQKSHELLEKLGTSLPGDLEGLARFDILESGAAVAAGDPLFPRMKVLPPAIQEALDAAEAETAASEGEEPSSSPTAEEQPPPEVTSAPDTTPTPQTPTVDIDTFGRVRLAVGTVLEATAHPKADRLLVLKVDVGEDAPRTLVAGLADRYEPSDLEGRQVVVVANLAPAKIRGVVSEGMVLAAGAERVEALLSPSQAVPPGTVVR